MNKLDWFSWVPPDGRGPPEVRATRITPGGRSSRYQYRIFSPYYGLNPCEWFGHANGKLLVRGDLTECLEACQEFEDKKEREASE